MNGKFKVLPVSEEWTMFSNKQQVESHKEKKEWTARATMADHNDAWTAWT